MTFLLLFALVAIFVINIQVGSYSRNKIYSDIATLPSEGRIAIVLGARVEDDGTPSNTLYDRTLVGVELYRAGKARKLLLSGGNREPEVMKKLAMELGVPETDLVLDDLGVRTYDSCVRAKQVFDITKALVVTQDYHLPRSIYLCESVGIDATGVDAKRRDYLGERWLWVRECLSRVIACCDVNFRPLPPEPAEKHPIR